MSAPKETFNFSVSSYKVTPLGQHECSFELDPDVDLEDDKNVSDKLEKNLIIDSSLNITNSSRLHASIPHPHEKLNFVRKNQSSPNLK